MNVFRLFCAVIVSSGICIVTAACGTMPSKNLEKLRAVPATQVYSTPLELLEKTPPTLELDAKPIDFSFTENDKILNSSLGPVPAKTLRIKVNGRETPYLTIAGFMHKVSFGSPGVVTAKALVYSRDGHLMKAPFVQGGRQPNCGLLQCMKLTYRIENLPPGTYNLVLYAFVEHPDQPLEIAPCDTTTYTQRVGAVSVHRDVAYYADYFGDVRISFERTLPLDPKRDDVFTEK
jgi:hypothetical protein